METALANEADAFNPDAIISNKKGSPNFLDIFHAKLTFIS
jgi:hypothetical protein